MTKFFFIIFVLILFASCTHTVPPKNINEYAVIYGGFGYDLSISKSVPQKKSSSEALLLFESMISTEENGTKLLGIQVDDLSYGILCHRHEIGSGQVAYCDVMTVAPFGIDLKDKIVFKGELARILFNGLKMHQIKNGKYEVGNLTCIKKNHFLRSTIECAMKRVDKSTVSIYRLIEQELITAEQARVLLEKLI